MFHSKNVLSMACACVLAMHANSVVAAGGGEFSWEEKNGRIDRKTICASHGYGSIAYRECRARAAKYLKQRCNTLTKQANSATGSSRASLKQDKKKFCHAARHFEIVN